MNDRLLYQCKHALMTNKTVERDIKLSLSDKCQLKRISKKIRNDHGGFENLSFEEYALLCKHLKKDVLLEVKDKYVTRIITLLNFNANTLRYILISMLHDIEDKNDCNIYDFDVTQAKLSIIDRHVVLFDEFQIWCKRLNASIKIN